VAVSQLDGGNISGTVVCVGSYNENYGYPGDTTCP
jgi:hypothetical protein